MNWSIKKPGGGVEGALSTEQLIWGLRRGDISPECWLRPESSESWQPIASIEVFEDLAAPNASFAAHEPLEPKQVALPYGVVVFVFAVGWLIL